MLLRSVGGSGACGDCVTALTNWLGILSERTMLNSFYENSP